MHCVQRYAYPGRWNCSHLRLVLPVRMHSTCERPLYSCRRQSHVYHLCLCDTTRLAKHTHLCCHASCRLIKIRFLADKHAGSRTETRRCLTMPIYPATLQQVPKPMDEHAVLACGQRLEAVLRQIHEKGYGHNDIKASNIFLSEKEAHLITVFKAPAQDPILLFICGCDLITSCFFPLIFSFHLFLCILS